MLEGKFICILRTGLMRGDRRTNRAAKAFRQAGANVCVVDMETDSAAPGAEAIDGTSVRHIVMPSWDRSTRIKLLVAAGMIRLFLTQLWLMLRLRADVYYAADFLSLPSCVLAGVIRRRPVVYDVRDLPFEDIPAYYNASRLRRAYRAAYVRLLKVLIPRCACVTTATPALADYVVAHYNPTSTALVRNLPEYKACARGDQLREYLQVPPTTRIALFQGYFAYGRSLDRIVRAARFVDEGCVIVLMGKGPEQPAIERMIEEEHVGDRVKTVPFIPYDRLLTWTASADIGLCIFSSGDSVNIASALPNKLWEYIMAGLPVLTTHSGIGAVLAHYGIGTTIDSLEPRAIALAINGMLADRQSLERMHLNALEACQRELCWEVEQQRLIETYATALSIDISCAPLFAGGPDAQTQTARPISQAFETSRVDSARGRQNG